MDKTIIKSSIVTSEIKSYSELLRCESIIRQHPGDCKKFIHVELLKLSVRLDVELTAGRAKILTEDLYDLYKHESLEDIQLCFKRGGMGEYGNNYNKLSMATLCQWMRQHLEKKSIQRETEQASSNTMHDWKDRKEYLKAVKAGDIIQKAIEKNKKSKKDGDYQKYKAEYLAKKLEEILNK